MFDHVKREQGLTYTIEDKSGRIEGDKDVKQLMVLRVLLETGVVQEHTLRSVEREGVSERCQELINGLKRDFPGRFTHLEISRAEAREVWAKGLAIERGLGQQLELSGVRERAREGKAQALENRREKIAEIAKARDRKERARLRLANIRQIVKAREEADRARAAGDAAARRVALEFPTPDQLRRIEAPAADRAKAPESERDRVNREAAEKTVREFQERLKIGSVQSMGKAPEKTTPGRESPEAAKAALVEQVERDAARLAAREFPFPVPDKPREQRAVEIGERTTPDLADAADKARETAAQQREAEAREAARTKAELDQARDAAYREMLNQAQVPKHVRLGLSHAQAPEAAVQTPPGQAPSVERGGTGQGRDPRTPEIGPRNR
ncbi:hypothetical protein [Nocardia sp. XZ_19_369]|uniref:hypothetical protein n=1 Tax=Nocardia sp. XZ_19_369 TaxID=2769487 RepID=UPI00189035BB|nr:hypothetical protein [Nocardia sp. XZ_19_369]